MKLIRSPLCGRVLVVGLLALVPAALATTASAASTTLGYNYACQGETPKGYMPANIAGQADVEAPDSVEHAADFKVVIKPVPFTVPQYIQGRKVVEITGARLYLELPANATFHGVELADSSGIGGADVEHIDDGLVVTVSGYLAGGETFQLPQITLKLEADFPDTEIVTKLGGTSYDDYGLYIDAKIQGMAGRIYDVGVSCFPDQGAVLSTTTVGSENNGENHGNNQNKPSTPPKPHRPHLAHEVHQIHKVCD